MQWRGKGIGKALGNKSFENIHSTVLKQIIRRAKIMILRWILKSFTSRSNYTSSIRLCSTAVTMQLSKGESLTASCFTLQTILGSNSQLETDNWQTAGDRQLFCPECMLLVRGGEPSRCPNPNHGQPSHETVLWFFLFVFFVKAKTLISISFSKVWGLQSHSVTTQPTDHWRNSAMQKYLPAVSQSTKALPLL